MLPEWVPFDSCWHITCLGRERSSLARATCKLHVIITDIEKLAPLPSATSTTFAPASHAIWPSPSCLWGRNATAMVDGCVASIWRTYSRDSHRTGGGSPPMPVHTHQEQVPSGLISCDIRKATQSSYHIFIVYLLPRHWQDPGIPIV